MLSSCSIANVVTVDSSRLLFAARNEVSMEGSTDNRGFGGCRASKRIDRLSQESDSKSYDSGLIAPTEARLRSEMVASSHCLLFHAVPCTVKCKKVLVFR